MCRRCAFAQLPTVVYMPDTDRAGLCCCHSQFSPLVFALLHVWALHLTLYALRTNVARMRPPLQPRVPQVHDNSSYHRQATADALPIAHDSPSIRRILGDTSDPLCVDSRLVVGGWPACLFHVSDAVLIFSVLTLHIFAWVYSPCVGAHIVLLFQKRSY
jgi:hypothetical protein